VAGVARQSRSAAAKARAKSRMLREIVFMRTGS
jgi:hypothetical protein